MAEKVIAEADVKMRKSGEAVQRELATIRTGRASPSLVEGVRVEYYGVPTPLKQLASISVPEARLILIQPWDRKIIGDIEKAILKSDLGIHPSSDGTVIRLNIPPLTEERRKDLVKVVHRKVEEGRISLRNLRREAVERLREMEKNKEISQDDMTRLLERLQKLTDGHMAAVDSLGQDKEKELLEF